MSGLSGGLAVVTGAGSGLGKATAPGPTRPGAAVVPGPLPLTELLRSLLAASPDARVVLVSSGGTYTQRLRSGDPEYRDGEHRGATTYARTKRMQAALVPVPAERYAADGIGVHGMHPGWADTPGVAGSLPGFRRLTKPLLRNAEEGADTVV